MSKNSIIKKFCDLFFLLPRDDCHLFSGLRKIIPLPMIMCLKSIRKRYLDISAPIRINKSVTGFLGPEFPPLHKNIEIDITYQCNLNCPHCNRFLDFAPSQTRMSVEQIEKFIRESIELGRKWRGILLSGGEPTYHPQILEIAKLVLDYKKGFSPYTKIWLLTSGFDTHMNTILSLIPPDIGIINSRKGNFFEKHYPVTIAPIDLNEYRNADFSNGCVITSTCAMGLNLHGYYQCTVAAAIDRLLGFDAGRKKLPSTNDNMIDLYRIFCQYCGHFLRRERKTKETISPIWEKAIDNYAKLKPCLTLY